MRVTEYLLGVSERLGTMSHRCRVAFVAWCSCRLLDQLFAAPPRHLRKDEANWLRAAADVLWNFATKGTGAEDASKLELQGPVLFQMSDYSAQSNLETVTLLQACNSLLRGLEVVRTGSAEAASLGAEFLLNVIDFEVNEEIAPSAAMLEEMKLQHAALRAIRETVNVESLRQVLDTVKPRQGDDDFLNDDLFSGESRLAIPSDLPASRVAHILRDSRMNAIHELEWSGLNNEVARQLANNLQTPQLRTFELRAPHVSDEVAVLLFARLSFFTSVEEIRIPQAQMGAGVVKEIAKRLGPPNLRRLDFGWNQMGAEGCKVLASNTGFRELRRLKLVANGIGDVGILALASSEYMQHLEALDVYDNGITQVGAASLAGSSVLHGLVELNLGRNCIGNEGFGELLRSKAFPELRKLSVSGNGVTERAIRYLDVAEPILSQLKELELGDNEVGGDFICRLLSFCRNLEDLRLFGCNLDERVGQAILESPLADSLQIRLSESEVGKKMAKKLQKNSGIG